MEKKIEELHQVLQSKEDTDPLHTGSGLKRLRNRVWFVVESMNSTLDIFLVYGVYGFIKPRLSVMQRAMALIKLEQVFHGLSLGVKIRKATEMKILAGELKGKYTQINRIRNHFAHPESHREKIKHYSTKAGQLEVLKKLVDALYFLDKHFTPIPKDAIV